MSKINSILAKGKTLLKEGLEPVEEGIHNFNNISTDIEKEAKRRINICIGCPMYAKEPVDFLAIKDERIPEASEMYCGDCGCTLPYKIRQTKKLCSKWPRKE